MQILCQALSGFPLYAPAELRKGAFQHLLETIRGLIELVPPWAYDPRFVLTLSALILLLILRERSLPQTPGSRLTTRTERGRSLLLVLFGSAFLLLVATLRPGAEVSPFLVGRLFFSLLLLIGISYLALLGRGGRDFGSVLEQISEEEGLTLIRSPQEEKQVGVLVTLRRFTDRDVRFWETEGSYPFLVGEVPEGLLTVRVPRGFDFDRESPLTTRISCFRRTDLYGFTVRDLEDPRGKGQKRVLTGNPRFDSLFRVSSRHPHEVEKVITRDVQELMVAEGSVGRGFRADTYGVKVYLPDRVVEPDILRRWLRIVLTAARNLE